MAQNWKTIDRVYSITLNNEPILWHSERSRRIEFLVPGLKSFSGRFTRCSFHAARPAPRTFTNWLLWDRLFRALYRLLVRRCSTARLRSRPAQLYYGSVSSFSPGSNFSSGATALPLRAFEFVLTKWPPPDRGEDAGHFKFWRRETGQSSDSNEEFRFPPQNKRQGIGK